MDFANYLPVAIVVVCVLSVLVYKYYSEKSKDSSEENKLFEAVRTIVHMLDDLDLSNEEKKGMALSYIQSISDRMGYKVDIQAIDDMIEDAVFILHETIKYIDLSKGD